MQGVGIDDGTAIKWTGFYECMKWGKSGIFIMENASRKLNFIGQDSRLCSKRPK